LPAWQADGAISPGEYAQQTEMAGLTFYWTSDGEYLYGAMSAMTNGWIAVGFDPEQRMKGANYIFGYVQDGETFIEDMFGTEPAGPGSHPPDTTLGGSNHILEYGGQEAGGRTVIEFKIPRDSGDAYDKPLTSGTHNLIVAVGPSDDFSTIHDSRGATTIDID
jgi:hypothetical protein